MLTNSINQFIQNSVSAGHINRFSFPMKNSDSKKLYACSCSSSCGSNYSRNGSCACSTSCGSNYSR